MKYLSKELIEKAKYYIGYLEKKSDKDLDDFTKNAGKNNYTKFCRDYEKYTNTNCFQPSPWCAEFISCIIVETYGLNDAKKLLCGNLVASCTICMNQFKSKNQYHKKNPIPGDIVLYYNTNKTGLAHCGLVIEVTSSKIKTVEGNTSSGNNVVIENGGAVAQKEYNINNTKIAGYCRMALDDTDPKVNSVNSKEISDFQKWLNQNYRSGLDVDGSYGPLTKKAAIKAYQTYLNSQFGTSLNIDGYWGPKTESMANCLRKGYKGIPVFILQGVLYGLKYNPNGFDGSYGPGCESAVKEVQKKELSPSDVDGICGPKTWAVLFE